MIQALELDDWKIAARSVTPAEAAAVLAEIEGRDSPCAPAEAAELAAGLIALWPAKDLANPDAYAAAVTALFASYPRDIVKRICNPVTGLPSRLKFFPVIADLAEALRAETERRKRIAANARTVIEQAEKARQAAQDDAEWAKQRPPPEERAQRVQSLLRAAVKAPLDVADLPRPKPTTDPVEPATPAPKPWDVEQPPSAAMQRFMSKPLTPEAQAFADNPTEANWEKLRASARR